MSGLRIGIDGRVLCVHKIVVCCHGWKCEGDLGKNYKYKNTIGKEWKGEEGGNFVLCR